MKSIIINNSVVDAIARVTGELAIRDSFYQRDFLTIDVDRETKLRGFFFAVAICHQTHYLKSESKGIYGWDYLEDGFVRLMRDYPENLRPEWLAKQSLNEISHLLASTFSDSALPGHTTLDRLEERAFLMKNTSEHIQENFAGRFDRLLGSTDGNLLEDGQGVYELFPAMEAFRDPLQKKTTFLLKLLQDASLFRINDEENLLPVMDYHMMRVLLRTGAVEVGDEQLRTKLQQHYVLENDHGIRAACAQAMKEVGEKSGHGVLKMNDFYWTLGRSCCAETTLCHDKVCSKNPCTFFEVVDFDTHGKCALQNVCKGATQHGYRSLWQPVISTHFY